MATVQALPLVTHKALCGLHLRGDHRSDVNGGSCSGVGEVSRDKLKEAIKACILGYIAMHENDKHGSKPDYLHETLEDSQKGSDVLTDALLHEGEFDEGQSPGRDEAIGIGSASDADSQPLADENIRDILREIEDDILRKLPAMKYGVRLDGIKEKWTLTISEIGSQNTDSQPLADDERKYPCEKCGALRTKAEGGTTFTICEECWDELYKKPTNDSQQDTLLVFDEYCTVESGGYRNVSYDCPFLGSGEYCRYYEHALTKTPYPFKPIRCAACKDPVTGFPSGLALVGRK